MTLDLTRNAHKCVGRFAVALVALGWGSAELVGQNSQQQTLQLLDQLDRGWAEHWREQDLGRGKTEYRVVLDDGRAVLQATSQRSGSALWRELDVSSVQRATLTWRWKVAASLTDNLRERDRRGDDYAARVFVVFGPGAADLRRSKALCYVWAGNEAIDATYISPYATNVVTIVVESGDHRAGTWVLERRDVVADFRARFGETPDRIAAVALMVDTDDTRTSASASFADLALVTMTRRSERD